MIATISPGLAWLASATDTVSGRCLWDPEGPDPRDKAQPHRRGIPECHASEHLSPTAVQKLAAPLAEVEGLRRQCRGHPGWFPSLNIGVYWASCALFFGLSYLLREAAPVASVHCPQGRALPQPGALQPRPPLPSASAWPPHSMAPYPGLTLTRSILTPATPVPTPFPNALKPPLAWPRFQAVAPRGQPGAGHSQNHSPGRSPQRVGAGEGAGEARAQAHLSLFFKYPLAPSLLGFVPLPVFILFFLPFPDAHLFCTLEPSYE